MVRRVNYYYYYYDVGLPGRSAARRSARAIARATARARLFRESPLLRLPLGVFSEEEEKPADRRNIGYVPAGYV